MAKKHFIFILYLLLPLLLTVLLSVHTLFQKDSLEQLNEAIRRNEKATIYAILNSPFTPNLDPPYRFGELNKPLFLAARFSDTQVIEWLLNAGADINGICSYEDTPLITALEHQQYENARYLIEKGADVNKPNLFGYSPFIGLSEYGPLDLFELALANGGDVNKAHPCLVSTCKPGAMNETPLEKAKKVNDQSLFSSMEEYQNVLHTRKQIQEILIQHGAKNTP